VKKITSSQRGNFQSTVVFILASLGSAVGVANLIAFPQLLFTHGILFLFVYLLFTFTVGVPLMTMEIAIGHKTKASPVIAYETLGGRKWKSIGIVNIICCFVLFPIFVMFLTWTTRYFIGFLFDSTPRNFGAYAQSHSAEVLLIAAVLIGIVVFVVALGVSDGIGRVSKIVVPCFGLMLLFFAVRNLANWTAVAASFGKTFSTFPHGIAEWKSMLSDALGQAFFSLSLGAGSMLMYGSYLKNDPTAKRPQKILTLSNVIVQSDTIVALMCCLFVFPLGVSMETGPAFIFETLYHYFDSLFYSRLLGSIFFLSLSLIALAMTISVFEPVVGSAVEILKKRRWIAAVVVGFLGFLLFIPIALSFGADITFTEFVVINGKAKSFFDLAFDAFINIALPLSGLLTVLFVTNKWKLEAFETEAGIEGSSSFLQRTMRLCARIITPTLLVIVLISKVSEFLASIG
jgi:NSS family neurotransmitter:Na+ symporter